MRVNPVNKAFYGQNRIKNQPSFGAVLLNKTTITDRSTGKPVDVAIVELETEYRELLADLRLKHKNDISEEEFKNMVDKERESIKNNAWEATKIPYKNLYNVYPRPGELSGKIPLIDTRNPFVAPIEMGAAVLKLMCLVYEIENQPSENELKQAERDSMELAEEYYKISRDTRPETNFVETLIMDDLVKKSGDKLYKGDFELMQQLAEQDYDIADVNERVKERNLMTTGEGNVTSMGKYLQRLTNGQREVMPKGGYGMLKKEYGEGVAYLPDTMDALIWSDNYNSPRQRILMAVEPQADENYRNLKPDTKVYGMAEIYTDRAMDVVEDMTSEKVDKEVERMNGIIQADKEFDELFQKFKESGGKDESIRTQLSQMAQDICKKYDIAWGDFIGLTGKGKESYIIEDVPDYVGKKALKEMNIPEDNVRPVEIWKLFSTDNNFKGTEETLLDAICKKAKFSGIFTDMWVSDAINRCKGFKVLPAWNGEKLFKEGVIKRKNLFGIKI